MTAKQDQKTDRACRFMVVQIHPSAHPLDEGIRSNALTGRGVLVPMSADGFYAKQQDADALAAMLREEHPGIDVYVLEAKSMNGQPL